MSVRFLSPDGELTGESIEFDLDDPALEPDTEGDRVDLRITLAELESSDVEARTGGETVVSRIERLNDGFDPNDETISFELVDRESGFTPLTLRRVTLPDWVTDDAVPKIVRVTLLYDETASGDGG